jgi:hypothetical protein
MAAPPHEVSDSPDQASHYHTLSPKLGATSLTRYLTGLGINAFLLGSAILKKYDIRVRTEFN